jgi:hypothetical protein
VDPKIGIDPGHIDGHLIGMQTINRAPDATVFLSTAALIVGIFLTAAAAALASNLPSRLEELTQPASKADRNERYARLIRTILTVLLITNTAGTLFPFLLLAVDTVGRIQAAWIWVVFSYTVCVIFVNLGAVSTIYLGPILARKHTVKSKSVTEKAR